MLQDFIPPSSFLTNTFFMDLSLGNRVFYTRSNGGVHATVVGMAGDGLIHLEYYQDALQVVKSPMQDGVHVYLVDNGTERQLCVLEGGDQCAVHGFSSCA